MHTKNSKQTERTQSHPFKPAASLCYVTEGCGTDGVADDNSNVTCLCSYLVDKSFSTILLGIYRLSF